MQKYFKALMEFFRDLPGEDGASDYQTDDPHDSPDPQTVTRIFGNAIEKGEWK